MVVSGVVIHPLEEWDFAAHLRREGFESELLYVAEGPTWRHIQDRRLAVANDEEAQLVGEGAGRFDGMGFDRDRSCNCTVSQTVGKAGPQGPQARIGDVEWKDRCGPDLEKQEPKKHPYNQKVGGTPKEQSCKQELENW